MGACFFVYFMVEYVYAGVLKLVYKRVLEARPVRVVGSSPTSGTFLRFYQRQFVCGNFKLGSVFLPVLIYGSD